MVSLNFSLIFLLPGRPTEIEEKDVYVCEERYNEHDKDFKKLKGLKVILMGQLARYAYFLPYQKFLLSPEVVADEVYYFQEEIIPYKVNTLIIANVTITVYTIGSFSTFVFPSIRNTSSQ